MTRHMAYALVTDDEYKILRAKAAAAGLTVSDYVRRAINALWLEEGDDGPLLEERHRYRRGSRYKLPLNL